VSFSRTAAEAIVAQEKPACLNYFGDHDPSGRDITRATEEGLCEFAPNADIYFRRVAVTQGTDLYIPVTDQTNEENGLAQ
jgi:hypothetical protein